MTERPDALLGALLGLAVVVLAAAGSMLAVLTDCTVGGLAMRVLASLSACVVFFHDVRSVPFGGLVLAVLVLASLAAVVRELGRAHAAHRLLRQLPLDSLDPDLGRGLGRRESVRVFVVPASRPFAFCAGLLRPRVVVSASLLERLDEQERTAALWHEIAHARRREPLKTLLARAAAGALFWLPAVRDLLERYLLAKELAADGLALRKTSAQALAGALCGVLETPSPAGAVGLADLAGARIERLLDPTASLPPLFCRRRLAATIATLAALGFAVSVPIGVGIGRIDALHAALGALF